MTEPRVTVKIETDGGRCGGKCPYLACRPASEWPHSSVGMSECVLWHEYLREENGQEIRCEKCLIATGHKDPDIDTSGIKCKIEGLHCTDYSLGIFDAIRKGDATMCAIIKSVSKSGMNRTMKFYAVYRGEPVCMTFAIAEILGEKIRDDDTIRVTGCGMDMVFATLYRAYSNLGWPEQEALRRAGDRRVL